MVSREKRSTARKMIAVIVLVQVVALIGYFALNQHLTDDGLDQQMVDILDTAERSSTVSVNRFSGEVDNAIRAMMAIVGDTAADDPTEHTEEMFHALEFVPHLSGVFKGDDNGDFIFVRRTEEGYATKIITAERNGADRTVRLTERTSDFAIVSESIDTGDSYDPRIRPWFTAATDRDLDVIWTGVYDFFTTGNPGVTLAGWVSAPDHDWVVGVDVELARMVDFLEELSTQIGGEVFLYDGEHTVLTREGRVEFEDRDALLAAPNGLRISSALDARSEADGMYETDGVRHLARFTPTAFGGDWMIGLDIAEDEVVGPVRGLLGTQRNLALGIGAFSGLLLALLFVSATRPIKRLELDSLTDELTSLPNRRAIVRRAEELLRSEVISLATIDLDHFKQVNDAHGHPVGDEAIREFTRRLGGEGVEVGRIGGEEFVMLLRRGTEIEDHDFARRLCARLAAEPVPTTAGALRITASVGLTRSRMGESFQDVWRRSDQALFLAKARGRNQVVALSSAGIPTSSTTVAVRDRTLVSLTDTAPTAN